MIRKTIKGGDFKSQMVGELVFDQVPEEGSFNPVTSDAVAKIASDVAGVQEDMDAIEGMIPSDATSANKLVSESGLQDAIDNASESWSTGFTPKGESSVSDLNDLATQSNGDSYIVTDSGTLTDGSLAVVAGDQVAWDATNSVWYKLPQYASLKFVKEEIDESTFDITTGLTITKESSLVQVMDGYVGNPEGGIGTNEIYVSYIYDVNEDTTMYVEPDNSSYLSVSISNAELTSGIRYRQKASSPSEYTLPTEENPVNVSAGKRLIISQLKTGVAKWNVVLPEEKWRSSFNKNIPLAQSHVEQVINKIIDGKILVKYVNTAGTEDSTERVEVYVPTKVGYVQYLFLHNVNVSRNCDVWRVAYAYACTANLKQRFSLTRAGEWECAIRLEDRDDFAGGYTHGDEILVGSPIFFVDGKEILLSDIAALTKCKEFRCVTKSSMIDPSNSETIFATHGCEHQFTANGLRVRQSIEWLGTYNIINTYMAMNLPFKEYTDTYYTDKDVFAQAIPNPLSKHEIGAGYLCMFKDSAKTFNEFYLGKDYPADPWLYLTDNGSTYNKGYFVINMSTPREITSGTRWKAEFYTRYEVGA